LNQFGSFNRIIFWLWYIETICFGGNGGFLFDSFSEELISLGKMAINRKVIKLIKYKTRPK
jgi:hypothetical protein